MTSSAKSVIVLHDVDVQDGNLRLNSITFDVPQSSCFALLALPGSGKTTIVKTLAGLIVPNSGTGHILGYPLYDPHITRDKHIGFLHQAVAWSASLTISDMMRLAAKQHLDTISDHEIEALISLAGLQERQDLTCDRLTKLERQLAGLIAQHIRNPDILILDDPTDNLPVEERRVVLNLIEYIGRGRTVFFTSSHLSDVQQLASHVAVLHQGNILAQGEAKATLDRPDTALFRVLLLGDAQLVFEQLRTLAWISEITQKTDGIYTEWLIWLRDRGDTPSHLLRAILADRRLQIIEFNQIRPRLDELLNKLEQATLR